MIRLIELFSGIGSQATALKRLGIDFKTVAVCEIDETAHKSYEALHGKTLNLGDITKVDELPECDILTYSFPCQDLSLAGDVKGMAEGSGTRSSLLWEVGRLLEGHKPEWLLMENVPMVISKRNIVDFNLWIKRLSNMGYNSTYKILNAVDFGVPQNRERCFMISRLNDIVPDLPVGKIKRRKLKEFLEDDVGEKYYLADSEMKGLKPYYGRGVCEQVMEIPGQYVMNTRVYSIEAAAPTITTKPERKFLIKNGNHTGILIRRLTPRECWRLMGFTDDEFNKAEKVTSERQLHNQAGNSIVVNVLVEIFRSMFFMTGGQSRL